MMDCPSFCCNSSNNNNDLTFYNTP